MPNEVITAIITSLVTLGGSQVVLEWIKGRNRVQEITLQDRINEREGEFSELDKMRTENREIRELVYSLTVDHARCLARTQDLERKIALLEEEVRMLKDANSAKHR